MFTGDGLQQSEVGWERAVLGNFSHSDELGTFLGLWNVINNDVGLLGDVGSKQKHSMAFALFTRGAGC